MGVFKEKEIERPLCFITEVKKRSTPLSKAQQLSLFDMASRVGEALLQSQEKRGTSSSLMLKDLVEQVRVSQEKLNESRRKELKSKSYRWVS